MLCNRLLLFPFVTLHLTGGHCMVAGAAEPKSQDPSDIVAGWIADAIPREYEKKEGWGRTRRVTVGLDTSRRGLRVRKKQVPHGVWKHYRVTLSGEEKALGVQVDELRAIAPGRAGATICVSAPLEFWGRTRIYSHGVHLGTYTAQGSATVHLTVDCEIGVRVESDGALPEVVVEPLVHRAEVKLRDFHLDRISNADGPVVDELAKVARHLLEDELAPHKLTKKLNRAIAKKQDRLQWNLEELVGLGEMAGNDE